MQRIIIFTLMLSAMNFNVYPTKIIPDKDCSTCVIAINTVLNRLKAKYKNEIAEIKNNPDNTITITYQLNIDPEIKSLIDREALDAIKPINSKTEIAS